MAGASDRPPQPTSFVLDCSTALAWCFTDERTPVADAALDALVTRPAVVPALWPYEIANALLSGERRRRATSEDTAAWLRFLGQLPITVDEAPVSRVWGDILDLARAHQLSAYDAAYLELARRRTLPLATLDRRLKGAAKAAGVTTSSA